MENKLKYTKIYTCAVLCLVTQLSPNLCNLMDYSVPGSSVYGDWKLSRQEYQSGSPYASPGDLPNPGIEPRSPALLVGSLPFESPGKPHKYTYIYILYIIYIHT